MHNISSETLKQKRETMSTVNCFCVGFCSVISGEEVEVKMFRAFTTFVEALNWLRRNRNTINGLSIYRETMTEVTVYVGY